MKICMTRPAHPSRYELRYIFPGRERRRRSSPGEGRIYL